MTIQTQVHGNTQPGEFLVGSMTFYTIATVVPSYPTNAKTPLAQVLAALNATALSSSASWTIVDGFGASVTYTTNQDYLDALAMQANLDALIKTFSTRVNPVIVNVSYSSMSASGTILANAQPATQFGSVFTGTIGVYFVTLVAERNPAWLVDAASANTNVLGYEFLSSTSSYGGITGVPAQSTVNSVLAGPANASAPAVSVTAFDGTTAATGNILAVISSSFVKANYLNQP